MCVDELVAQGLRLAELDGRTVEFMRTWAPPEASLRNPIDLTPQASLDDYRRALDAVLRDDAVDAAIAIYVPPVRVDEVEVARAIWQTAERGGKPILCNFLGRTEESPGFVELVRHGVPSYLFPESAARALGAMHRYAKYRAREEGETPTFAVDRSRAAAILRRAQDEGRTRLRDPEALDVLDAYGIRIARNRFVADLAALPAAAKEIGYPVVLKAIGPGLVHKTDLRAVLLDVRSEKDLVRGAIEMGERLHAAGTSVDGYAVQEFVRGGKEVILGMTRDKVYGPFLVFGLGGIYVEYLKDVAFGLPPLTDRDARRMIESIRTYPLLEGVRGEPPSDVDALVDAVLRLSQLVLDFDSIQEIDLNPIVALRKGEGYRAVDARIVLGPAAKPPHPLGPEEGAQSSIQIPSGSRT